MSVVVGTQQNSNAFFTKWLPADFEKK